MQGADQVFKEIPRLVFSCNPWGCGIIKLLHNAVLWSSYKIFQ